MFLLQDVLEFFLEFGVTSRLPRHLGAKHHWGQDERRLVQSASALYVAAAQSPGRPPRVRGVELTLRVVSPEPSGREALPASSLLAWCLVSSHRLP